ncbi:histidine kinase [Nocardia sp. NPDC048505]|uniref:sensor histidine kinase n=1 Tax=Nocardia sp. NPDC048505 TaxID=3155756 RepID=UPI0033D93B66
MAESSGVDRGVEWLLDVRSLPIRMAVLVALGVGCNLWIVNAPTGRDWTIAALSLLAVAGAGRLPLATALGSAALLLIGFEFGIAGPAVSKVAAAVALTELAARQGGWRPWAGAAALASAYLAHPAGGLAATGYRAVVMAVAPLLLGMLLRAARENAERARHEARRIARSRETEIAAARATERTAIARELHDLIAHHVSSTVLRVGVARHAVPDAPPALLAVLDDIHASGKATLTDLRKLVTILRDPRDGGTAFVAPADLPDALATVVDRAQRLGLRVDATIDARLPEVEATAGLTLLRLTQEGLANTAKHAGTDAEAQLTIAMTRTGVDFLLRDNGSRPAAPPADGAHGLGLIGLQERVALLGGTFTAGPAANGWHLTAHLPTAATESTATNTRTADKASPEQLHTGTDHGDGAPGPRHPHSTATTAAATATSTIATTATDVTANRETKAKRATATAPATTAMATTAAAAAAAKARSKAAAKTTAAAAKAVAPTTVAATTVAAETTATATATATAVEAAETKVEAAETKVRRATATAPATATTAGGDDGSGEGGSGEGGSGEGDGEGSRKGEIEGSGKDDSRGGGGSSADSSSGDNGGGGDDGDGNVGGGGGGGGGGVPAIAAMNETTAKAGTA